MARPARCYRGQTIRIKKGASGHARKITKKRPYTRIAIRVPRKNYIGSAPQLKIRQFNMGNPNLAYTTVADLVTKEGIDIRDNALESIRSSVNRTLVKELGKENFFMKVRVYPSNLMRENKQAQGAGADRISQGMSQSFGVPIGRSARTRKGQPLLSVLCMDEDKLLVKKNLMKVKSKLPCKVEVVFHTDIKRIGTLPTKTRDERVAEKAAAAEEEGKTDAKEKEKKDTKNSDKTKTDAKAPAKNEKK